MSKRTITRKDFLRRTGTALGGLLVGSALRPARAQKRDEHPNILFVCMDQLRSWLDVPEALPLPAFRRLLREGRGVPQLPRSPSAVRPVARHVLHGPAHPKDRHVHEPARRVRRVLAPTRRAASSSRRACRRSARCCASRATTRRTRASGTLRSSIKSLRPERASRRDEAARAVRILRLQLRRRVTRASRGSASATTA